MTIEDTGVSALTWQASIQGKYLSISPKSGSLGAGQTSQMQVTASSVILPTQTIYDHILFTSNGGTADVLVTPNFSGEILDDNRLTESLGSCTL